MNNIIKRKWNQNSMVIIEDLQGMTFQAESGGHTFQISGIDGEGNAVALSGTPAGVMLRADGQDVTLTCSASEGVISATLPANAYSVPGRFGLTIFLTSDGQKTAIYAAVGTVGKTSSGTVAPPAGSDVVTLVNQINTAIAAIPANYNACFAPAYSTSGLYSVGQYVTYNGNLYRCNTAITTAETWTAAHWTQTNLGADVYDLKSALSIAQTTSILCFTSPDKTPINITQNGWGLTVTVPDRLFFAGKTAAMFYKDFGADSSYSLSHNDVLIYNFNTQAIEKITYGTTGNVTDPYVLLVYNNRGVPFGQWSVYLKTENPIYNLIHSSIYCFSTPDRTPINIVTRDQNVIITVPNRLMFIGKTAGILIKDFSSDSSYELAHNGILIYNFTNGTLQTTSYDSIGSITGEFVVLVYNNRGYPFGQWEIYYENNNFLNYQFNNESTIFCSRQGQIYGYIENSLAGFLAAKKAGYNRARCSVQITSDGIPVLFHDATLGATLPIYDSSTGTRTTGNAIDTYTYSELYNNFRFGSTTNKIATLAELAEQSKKIGQVLDIELKDDIHSFTSDDLNTILGILSEHGILKETIFIGFYAATLTAIANKYEYANVGLASYPNTVGIDAVNGVQTKGDKWLVAFNIQASEFTKEIHTYGALRNIRFKYSSVTGVASLPNYYMFEMIECSGINYPAQYLT